MTREDWGQGGAIRVASSFPGESYEAHELLCDRSHMHTVWERKQIFATSDSIRFIILSSREGMVVRHQITSVLYVISLIRSLCAWGDGESSITFTTFSQDTVGDKHHGRMNMSSMHGHFSPPGRKTWHFTESIDSSFLSPLFHFSYIHT